MRIRVDNIPEEGQRIEGTIDPSSIELDMPGYSFIEPLAFVGRATRSAEDIIVEGSLTGTMKSQCGRCLNGFKMPLDMTMQVVFAPQEEPEADGGGKIDIGENFSYYDGNDIDLSQEVKDLILVNLPISPVCREDCKGLCPQCGVDLNASPCKCGDDKGPSPFDKLKQLKQQIE